MKIKTHNGDVDLGSLCLKTDTVNGKPILKMERSPKKDFLIWLTLATLTAGLGLYAKNHEQYVPVQQLAQYAEQTPTPYK